MSEKDTPRNPAVGGQISHVTGRADGRGIPEVSEITIDLQDGTTISARMPTPQGERSTARIVVTDVEYHAFDVCPICLEPGPTSREHVPPHSIGGNVLTLTCEKCNNEFGSKYEPHLLTWYEGSLGQVRISGGGVLGRRKGGDFLVRQSDDGTVMLLPVGKTDPAIYQMIEAGQFDLHMREPDAARIHIAAVKAAYLAACVMVGSLPFGPRGEIIRRELLAARDLPRGEPVVLSDLMKSILVGRGDAETVPGEVLLVARPLGKDSWMPAISFNRQFIVDWPLDRIEISDANADE